MGSNPVRVTFGGLAQLGERLPYKQRVTGSSPVSSIFFTLVPWSSWLGRLPVTQEITSSSLVGTAKNPACRSFDRRDFCDSAVQASGDDDEAGRQRRGVDPKRA